jgi:hypothetical protein
MFGHIVFGHIVSGHIVSGHIVLGHIVGVCDAKLRTQCLNGLLSGGGSVATIGSVGEVNH